MSGHRILVVDDESSIADDGVTFGVIGRDARMLHIRGMIRTAAPSDASVLIEGESGTGKELIATALHANSNRAGGPFISINCAAIPHELIESELFGYRKGAFTGAGRDKRGLIEAASGGTLLLDEIGEMPPHLQTKLLRVLQERMLRRLGGEQETEVDFRLISSTNRDTAQMLRDGALRNDLYFRISAVKIKVPSLRERSDDIALLSERFLRRYAEQYKRRIRGRVRSIREARLSLGAAHHSHQGRVPAPHSLDGARLIPRALSPITLRVNPDAVPEDQLAAEPAGDRD